MKKALDKSRYAIELEEGPLPIIIRKRPTSRRFVIRYQPLTHSLSLTLPRYASLRQGLDFVEEKRHWIASQLKEHAQKIPFADGQIIPVLGRNYTLRHIGGRGLVRIEGDLILVPGDADFMARRIREWLKNRARDAIVPLAHTKAAELGKTISRISLRDTVSHWGSCNRHHRLSFSWRLVFAPSHVLDYIVCHEVAHLDQLNHKPAFWKTVEKLCPEYETARQWLGKHGHTLYGYGL
jgi:predicted metal-dependent hydrolase